jgi:hypothetical protein
MSDTSAPDAGPPEEPVQMVFSDDSAHATEQAVRTGTEPGETEAVQMRGDHRNAGASVSEAGVVRYWISGADAGNGLVEFRAAASLVQKLNAAGADWAAPELTQTGSDAKREEGVDCTAVDNTDRQTILRIQVTRANADAWEPLRRDPSMLERCETVDSMVESICAAIERKRTHADRTIVLVLAAYDSPAHALHSVAQAFRTKHGQWARTAGFKEVWIVGPTAELVHRLDPSFAHGVVCCGEVRCRS